MGIFAGIGSSIQQHFILHVLLEKHKEDIEHDTMKDQAQAGGDPILLRGESYRACQSIGCGG